MMADENENLPSDLSLGRVWDVVRVPEGRLESLGAENAVQEISGIGVSQSAP